MYDRSTSVARVRISGLTRNPPARSHARRYVGPGEMVRIAVNLERLDARSQGTRQDGAALRRFAAAATLAAAAVTIFSHSIA